MSTIRDYITKKKVLRRNSVSSGDDQSMLERIKEDSREEEEIKGLQVLSNISPNLTPRNQTKVVDQRDQSNQQMKKIIEDQNDHGNDSIELNFVSSPKKKVIKNQIIIQPNSRSLLDRIRSDSKPKITSSLIYKDSKLSDQKSKDSTQLITSINKIKQTNNSEDKYQRKKKKISSKNGGNKIYLKKPPQINEKIRKAKQNMRSFNIGDKKRLKESQKRSFEEGSSNVSYRQNRAIRSPQMLSQQVSRNNSLHKVQNEIESIVHVFKKPPKLRSMNSARRYLLE